MRKQSENENDQLDTIQKGEAPQNALMAKGPASLRSVLDDMREASKAYEYSGPYDDEHSDSLEDSTSHIAFGNEDPRDSELEERLISEDAVYRGLIFDVNRVNVKLPNGNEAARDVVRHPGAVGIVALTDDGQICLVRQYRTALGRVTVEIPAGKLDPGEDPLSCAKRELEEETGMHAKNMAFLTTLATTCGFSDELIHLYMATGLSRGASHPDDDEFINVDLVPVEELVDAVLDGRIEDAKTVVGALICDAVSHRLETN